MCGASSGGFVLAVVELRDGLRGGEVVAEGVGVAFQELVLASFEEDVVGCEINYYAPCVEKDRPRLRGPCTRFGAPAPASGPPRT